MPESDNNQLWVTAEFILGVALVALVASFGGAPEWTSWILWASAMGALVFWTWGAAKHRRRAGWHPVLLFPLGVALVAGLQLIPLPPTMLAAVSPRQAELRDFALVPLGLTSWRPISVDPPSTLRALMRAVSLAIVLFVSLELGRIPGAKRRLLSLLAITGVVTVVCGLVHQLAGLDTLIGLHHFSGNVPFVTPFGNTNHLAAWLLLAASVAVGLSISSGRRDAMVGWGVVAGVNGVGLLLSLSRGGIATFLLTWGSLGALVLARRLGGLRGAFPWIAMGLVVLLASLLAFDQLLDRLDSVSSWDKLRTTKLELWPMFIRGLGPYWALGMGVGAFELGFSPFQTQELGLAFTHPEAFPIQWVADVGLPLAVLAAAGLVWCVRDVWRISGKRPLDAVLLFALGGLLVHDLFDFALELNALAFAATLVVGLIAARDGGPRITTRRPILVAVGVLALVGTWGLSEALPGYLTAEDALTTLRREGYPFPLVRAAAVERIDRHPADWVLYASTAQESARRASPLESLAWVNRVLLLRPFDATSHVSAAQALLRMKRPDQALGELRLAWENGDTRSLEQGLQLAAEQGVWERVVLDRPGHLEAAYVVLRNKRQVEQARALLSAAQDWAPSPQIAEEAQVLRIRLEVELGDPQAAVVAWQSLPDASRQRPELSALQAEALARLGRVDEAIELLERVLANAPSTVSAGFQLSELLRQQGKWAGARDVLQRVKPFVPSAQRAGLFQREGQLWVQEERYPRAIEAFETAARIDATSATLHYQLAEVYERMGSLHSAADEVRRGRLLDSPDGAASREAWLRRLEGPAGP